MRKGFLISLEGPDGAGKTTVLKGLIPRLESLGHTIITTREPGGVPIAEKIREVILDTSHVTMDDKTELLLYIAARRQHLKERVLPALEDGKLVLMDRFIDSSVAYQGFGRGLDTQAIEWLNNFATDGIKPDLTLYFDLDVKEGLSRIASGRGHEVNRLDLEGLELHQRVREGYLTILQDSPDRVVKIDASLPIEQVLENSWKVLSEKLGNR